MTMYFRSRAEAGSILAKELVDEYRFKNCAVVALSDGGVLVGEQIAAELHCILTMVVTESIEVPGEGVAFGGVSQTGDFTYNSMLSSGEISGYQSEFYGYFEEKKREAFQKINRLMGDGGTVDKDLLRDHTVILVSDGFGDGAALDAVMQFLKPIRIKRLVIVAPVATVPAVDRLHIAADELHILDVKTNYLGVDHYYEENDIPGHEETIAKINEIILNWR